MKAISVLQPWATALLTVKDVENRTWPLPEKYFGVPLALHASKRADWDEWHAYRDLCDLYRMHPGIGPFIALPYGAIIGVITFSANITRSDSPWFAGPYGWVKLDVKALPHPIPCRGALGLWDVPTELVEEIRRQKG